VSRWFEQQVEAALDELPPRIAEGLENVAIVVDDQHPEDPDLFGSWEAAPYMPDKITIYQGPHERDSRSRAELEKMVADTVWHEIAHHFGMDERRGRAAERRKRVRRSTARKSRNPASPGSSPPPGTDPSRER